jgi:nicotinate-nucleotide adenylyltransferase
LAATRAPRLVGVFGGTFDPIHYGHLRCAIEVGKALQLDQMLMVPAAVPPHRDTPMVEAEIRLNMVELAVAGEPMLHVDDRELNREGPSYMLDTLLEIKQQNEDNTHLVLILGDDAFEKLDSWYQWRHILKLAHICVVPRPNWVPPTRGIGWLNECEATWVDNPQELRVAECGKMIKTLVTSLAISATQIRTLCQQRSSARFLLPDVVWNYIETNRLYR